MFDKILVPLDRSTLSERALAVATSLARRNKARLILLHVTNPQLIFVEPVGSYPVPAVALQEMARIPEEYLRNLASSPDRKGIRIKSYVESGDPAGVICDVAVREECDLIVMSTHGRSGLRRWMMGSVTEKVLRYAPMAVFAVRSTELPRHFLLALDGSPTAELAIEPTLSLAKAVGAKVTFASIQDPRDAPDAALIEAIRPLDSGLAESIAVGFQDRARDYLRQMLPKYGNWGLELAGAGAVDHPAEGILTLAEKQKCDAIAMCTHGRTGLSRWRYGSITEKVLRHADRNMLIVRAKAREQETARLAEVKPEPEPSG